MEKLLKLASEQADQAEVYYNESVPDTIAFNDAKLESIDSSLSSGIALRLIKDHKAGFAHTTSLHSDDDLIRQALLSASNGIEAKYRLPATKAPIETCSYDDKIVKLNKQDLIDMGKGLINYVKSRSDGQINLHLSYVSQKDLLINSNGAEVSRKTSEFWMYMQMVFPGSGAGLMKFNTANGLCTISNEELDDMIELYEICKHEVVPPTSVMPVIFHSSSLHALMWRVNEALHPLNIYNGTSPLCGKQGTRIFSEKFSYAQNPLDSTMPIATAFDDEASPTKAFSFIEGGVFKAIPTNLYYAEKLKSHSTGNASRASLESMPGVRIINGSVATGQKSLNEMIASIDRGLIVFSLMGAHSGNILNGDYSVGIASGLMIENGKAIGRVKDCMLSGNIYESLQNIIDIENKTQQFNGSKMPSLLLDKINVAGK